MSLIHRKPRVRAMVNRPEWVDRPEVQRCLKRAEELVVERTEMLESAIFWAGLANHGHRERGEDACDDENCYEAWKEYPDG